MTNDTASPYGTAAASASDPSSPRHRPRRALALGLSITLIASAAVAGVAWRANVTPPADDLQRIVDGLVDGGYPAALATRTDPDGTHHEVRAGAADLENDSPVPEDGEVRIGSASKTFTAVVVLQLVEEGLVELDTGIEQYLPGVVRGDGVDASAITIRQLLQHTSGLPEYADLIAADAFAVRDTYRSPRSMLDVALQRPASFPAGERHEYSNTGYIVLGLLIEAITTRPLFEQIEARIVEPLGLDHTYLPREGERTIRGDHPKGYHVDKSGDLRDISSSDPSWTWAAGAMVSTPSELNDFMRAVLDGTLLDEPTMKQMLTGIPTGEELLPGSEYGLGIESVELTCGTAWGHSGDIPGFQTRNAVAADGTAFTVTVTALPWAIFDGPEAELLERYMIVIDTLDQALCNSDVPTP
ncbi:hypothetical protein B7R21_16860 [Subtercola boreus]|uniref:Beta-lactamase-related domain-containing protein n=1 Tax=Subtercola boreus TaxID=120213 RepID=A0A3E0VE31_9MICO|nr:serine hydrolase domain-containing protein [Subtercola boreus]RFA07127.1 hypothetical protein B7R21_16860 [Subtercola boreus]